MLPNVLAVFMLTVCVALMLRLLMGARRRYALDAWLKRTGLRLKHATLGLYRRRSSRKTAERLAEEAIRRARGEGHWEGNVYKPKSFRKPPRDKMH